MAGIKDILKIEQQRESSDDWTCIHLFQEGSFYRAYEVSAWLCTDNNAYYLNFNSDNWNNNNRYNGQSVRAVCP